MPAIEAVRDQTHLDPNAIDPNVVVPSHIREAAERAEALHQQAYPTSTEPSSEEAARVAAEAEANFAKAQADAEAARVAAEQAQQQPHQQQPLTHQQENEDNVSAAEWKNRYLSMKGRYEATQRTVGSMEEQMRQLGVELTRTQALVGQQQPQPAQQQAPVHDNLITAEDRANYGDDLIDLARRSALSAVTPELMALRADNQRLTQRVTSSAKKDLFGVLDAKVPNWRAINTSTQFKAWLSLPNIYTGQVRGQMLKAAVDGAEAPKVLALFKDFLAEVNATGQTAPTAQVEQQQAPQQQAAPRTAALDLESLASPGRAKPASGDGQVPADKPIYTRAIISKFYDDKRRGLYAGRDAEVRAFEADLTAAQREGRVRG